MLTYKILTVSMRCHVVVQPTAAKIISNRFNYYKKSLSLNTIIRKKRIIIDPVLKTNREEYIKNHDRYKWTELRNKSGGLLRWQRICNRVNNF